MNLCEGSSEPDGKRLVQFRKGEIVILLCILSDLTKDEFPLFCACVRLAFWLYLADDEQFVCLGGLQAAFCCENDAESGFRYAVSAVVSVIWNSVCCAGNASFPDERKRQMTAEIAYVSSLNPIFVYC